MTPAERRTVIRALADFLVPRSQNEVYEYLFAVTSGYSVTPSVPTFGDEQPEDLRRVEIRGVLLNMKDDSLVELVDFSL
jgi:hypothetical protein